MKKILPGKRFFLVLPGGGSVLPQTFNGDIVNITSLGNLISKLYAIIIPIAGFLLLFWLAWGVFEYLFAGGDKDKLARAQRRLTWAIIGFVILILAYTIQQYTHDILAPFMINPTLPSAATN